MSVSIRGCPACSAMLIGDSAACPHCGHVIDPHRASQEFLELIPATEIRVRENTEDEHACKQCGEMVRVGLVRCWHCGAFTNSEIEASYQRMQANPAPIMYSDVNGIQRQAPQQAEAYGPAVEDDGDFELAVEYGGAGKPQTTTPQNSTPPATTPPAQPTTATYNQQAPLSTSSDDDEDDFTLTIDPAPVDVYTPVPQNGQSDYSYMPPPQHVDESQASDQQGYDQQGYDQQGYDQQGYDQQQYEVPWGYKLNADGTAYEIDYEAWQAAGYDPYAQPGEPGYYDPYAGQNYDQQQYSADDYSAAAADAAPIGQVAPDSAAEVPTQTGSSASASEIEAAAAAQHGMPPEPDVPHSVSTGGETLFATAIAEERESALVRKAQAKRRLSGRDAPPGSFLVYCPNGHRVQVQERHRGRAGRCPSCKAVFFVPTIDPAVTPDAPERAVADAPSGKYEVGAYKNWLFDLRLHTVNPQKLKLKPGAMASEYDVADVGFTADSMLVATVFKRSGTFAAMQEKKKKPAARQEIAEYLETGKPLSGLPAPFQSLVTADDAGQLKIVQPAVPGEESLFAGIPVFGEGQIVVRLPVQLEGNSRAYVSFSLSEFREFARLLQEVFGIVEFGQELGIPLSDTISNYKCHYTETDLPALEYAEYYQYDPALKPILLGRKCAGCGLTVSEDARKKEKIGGKTDASIAKANCPKCTKKFGDIKLFGLDPNAKPIEFGKLPEEK